MAETTRARDSATASGVRRSGTDPCGCGTWRKILEGDSPGERLAGVLSSRGPPKEGGEPIDEEGSASSDSAAEAGAIDEEGSASSDSAAEAGAIDEEGSASSDSAAEAGAVTGV